MAEVKVSLNQFEGPLGLLLFLIRKEEMDIFDINIVQVTDQYLAYVKNMKTLDLEGAGDFIAMAATLIQIKSKMLMPTELLDEDEEEMDDPRKELVDKLLEYQKYQEISKQIYDKPLLGRDVWTKGFKEKGLKRPDDVVKVDDNPLYSLILHYKKALTKVNKVVHKVGAKIQSIASRVLEIKVILIQKSKTSLKELWEAPSDFTSDEKSRLLITFLSMLELSKMGYTSIFQSQNYADIHINVKKDLSGDVVSQVEDYEKLDEDLNTTLFADSKIEFDAEEIFADDDSDEEEATDEEILMAESQL
ncbi:MAG: segregation and condensation protein A [Bdellovibrionales bacterium]